MIEWIKSNKSWVFSGLGVFVLSGVISFFADTKKPQENIKENPAPTTIPVTTKTAQAQDIRYQLVEPKPEPSSPRSNDAKMMPDDEIQKAYIKLFESYTRYFIKSLKPRASEEIISDDVVEHIAYNIFYVNEKGEIYGAVAPWNYASLFREQLGFFDFRDAVKITVDNERVEGWHPYSDNRNPIDEIYYKIQDEIRDNLREYLADKTRLEAFYNKKKRPIIKGIERKISIRYKSSLFKLLTRMIDSCNLIAKAGIRKKFEELLALEARHNSSNDSELGRNDEYRRLVNLFPDIKAARFAYRRHVEGGDQLVETYARIIGDIRASLYVYK